MDPATAEFPYGEARNITAPGDGTGTPWERDIINDNLGMQQALLTRAGITPSGIPDNAVASQYIQAMLAVSGANYPDVASMVADLELAIGTVIVLQDYATGHNAGVLFGVVVANATGTADGG